MSQKIWIKTFNRIIIALALIAVITLPSFGAEFNLNADMTTMTMPDGNMITMWGFGLDGGSVTVPGPLLVVPPGDSTLTINLTNNLPVPVSIVIPGQPAALSPVWFIDAQGRARVQSFTQETAANGGVGTYIWNNLKPGTYIYHSGTHPQVQVQMGLYGGLKRDVSAGNVYTGIPYDNEAVFIFSEIDPALHAAVSDGIYGTGAYPSTINYAPRYFLINGKSFPDAAPILGHTINPDERVLIRFLNAGLKTHVPALQSLYMRVIAEDGNVYPYSKEQYSVMLPALKTIDAVLTPQAGRYPVYDRALNLVNGAQPNGGMLAYLRVEPNLMTLVIWYYNSILNRAPEPGGAEYWTGEIQRIDTLGIDIKEGYIALGKFFFNSAEYLAMNTTNNQYITDLYETFLGRTPTQGEVDGWAGELAGGLTRNLLLNYFIFSQEFMQYMTGYFGDTSVRPEYNLVNDLYRGLLSRLPDDAGFNYWLAQMQDAQCNGNAQAIRDYTLQLALLFLNSQEYADRNTSNSECIEDYYNGILRRGAELAGYQYWLGALNGGAYTRETLLTEFVNSAEFQTRVTEVINAGCSP